MLLWAGDSTARWLEPAASSVRGRAEAAQGLFVPPEDPAVAIEEGSREQAACPAPLPPRLFSSSSSLTGYTDGVLWIKIRSRARGWGGNQSPSLFAFETGS